MDALLRAAIVALALTAAVAIVARPNRNAIAFYAAYITVGIAAFAISSAPGIFRSLGLAAFVFDAWCLSTPAVVYLAARAMFIDDDDYPLPGPPPRGRENVGPNGRENVGPKEIVAVGALVAVTMLGDFGRFQLGWMAAEPAAARVLLLAGRGTALALLLGACAMAAAHWRTDLVEPRRRARVVFVAAVGAAFVALASSEFVFGGNGAPLELLIAGHSLLVILVAGILIALVRGDLDALITETAKAPARSLSVVRSDAAEATLGQRVLEEMASRKLWKRDGLGIADLAGELRTQEHKLRRAINHHLGFRNFNDFLHDYRLREAAARLRDPAEAHLPVLTIALDCGYGSIGPFNRAFKARFGVTPSQFRNLEAAERADSEIGERLS